MNRYLALYVNQASLGISVINQDLLCSAGHTNSAEKAEGKQNLLVDTLDGLWKHQEPNFLLEQKFNLLVAQVEPHCSICSFFSKPSKVWTDVVELLKQRTSDLCRTFMPPWPWVLSRPRFLSVPADVSLIRPCHHHHHHRRRRRRHHRHDHHHHHHYHHRRRRRHQYRQFTMV